MEKPLPNVLQFPASMLGPRRGLYRLRSEAIYPLRDTLERIVMTIDPESAGIERVGGGSLRIPIGYFTNPSRPRGRTTFSVTKRNDYYIHPFCAVYEGVKSLEDPLIPAYERLSIRGGSPIGELHLLQGTLWQHIDGLGIMHRVPTEDALREKIDELLFQTTEYFDEHYRLIEQGTQGPSN